MASDAGKWRESFDDFLSRNVVLPTGMRTSCQTRLKLPSPANSMRSLVLTRGGEIEVL